MAESYEDLYELIGEVAAQAAYAELRLYGWYPDGNGNVTYTAVGLGGGGTQTAAGPGNGYPSDPLANYTSQGEGYPDGLDGAVTLGDVYRHWENQVEPVFDVFRGLPDPSGLQELADEVRTTLMQISSSGATGSGDSTADDANNLDYDANTTLGLATQVAQQLNTWQGGSAVAFATYLNLFREVVNNQANACEVLRISILMEKEMMQRLRDDVTMMAVNAAAAFSQCGQFGRSELKAILSVAGTVNTVLGWFPAFKPVTTGTGMVLTVSGVLVDTLVGEVPEIPLGAFHFKDVMSNLETAAEDLLTKCQQVEQDIESGLNNLKSHVESAPAARPDGPTDQEAFRLGRPHETYQATGRDDFIYPEVVVNPANVRTAAGQIHDELAPEMRTAADSLRSSDRAMPWYRWHSQIGVGTFGASDAYGLAYKALHTEIDETASEMEWAGDMLVALADDVEGVDQNIGTDFANTRRDVEAAENGG